MFFVLFFFFSSRRRHTRCGRDWSSDVCSSDLGEDWAVYRTGDGAYGIVEEHCPHRRASLAYGVAERDGIRCGYHGWLFGLDGTCLDQPAEMEKTAFRDRVKANAGLAQELGGMVWV